MQGPELQGSTQQNNAHEIKEDYCMCACVYVNKTKCWQEFYFKWEMPGEIGQTF